MERSNTIETDDAEFNKILEKILSSSQKLSQINGKDG